jgi:hypothetical protein
MPQSKCPGAPADPPTQSPCIRPLDQRIASIPVDVAWIFELEISQSLTVLAKADLDIAPGMSRKRSCGASIVWINTSAYFVICPRLCSAPSAVEPNETLRGVWCSCFQFSTALARQRWTRRCLPSSLHSNPQYMLADTSFHSSGQPTPPDAFSIGPLLMFRLPTKNNQFFRAFWMSGPSMPP